MARAYCWATGLIGIGDHLPRGALPLMRGRKRDLIQTVITLARHSYEDGRFLVPGVPEAANQLQAFEAVSAFIQECEKRRASSFRTVPLASQIGEVA